MSPSFDKFVEFQQLLVANVEKNSECLGLMFAGSAANLSRVDEHSDQDFFLIVSDGLAEQFRLDLTWLPNSQDILLSPRETEHGLKVLYRDGMLLEFAVFEESELASHMAPRDNRVAFDRKNISEVIAEISKKSHPRKFEPLDEYQLFLTLIQIGAGRVKRGEVIAGSQHIKSYAVNALLGLIRHFEPVADPHLDSLDRFRRFEVDYPELGARISDLLESPSLKCAVGLLEISDRLPVSDTFAEARNQIMASLMR